MCMRQRGQLSLCSLAFWFHTKKNAREGGKARRRWRRVKNETLYRLFKDLRNEVQSLVKEVKRRYCTEFFGNCTDQREVWNKLRHLGLIKSRTSMCPLPCSVDELNYTFFLFGWTGWWNQNMSTLERLSIMIINFIGEIFLLETWS